MTAAFVARIRLRDEDGSSIAEFAMISVLLVFLLFAVLQVAAYFYVKSIVSAAASDGARYGANAGLDPAVGGDRANLLVSQALSTRMSQRLPCAGDQTVDTASGMVAARVKCHGQIKSIFFPVGAFVTIDVTGRSLKERP
jgi:Flp pilus assembly protein TadG